MASGKEALQQANADLQSNETRNGPYKKAFAHYEKLQTYQYLRDDMNAKRMAADLQDLNNAIDGIKKGMSAGSNAANALGDAIKSIADKQRELNKENVGLQERLKTYQELRKVLDKINISDLDKDTRKLLYDIENGFSEAFDIAKNFNKRIKEESQSLTKSLMDGLDNVQDRIVKLSNAFSLQKLVTGGTSLNDLQKMQGNVKMTLNVDTAGFLSVQGQLVQQNKELLAQTGQAYLTFSDSINYLSNIKDYSVKNYNQATAIYKQVSMGTRYLGLSNQGITAMVKATNQMADDSYMNRQLALLSALGTDAGLSEDLESLAQFQASNLTAVNARYANGNDMLKQASVFKSVSDAYLGGNSKLIENMMSEIMNVNNFASLSSNTQDLLSMAGVTSTLARQMQSGNVNMNQIMNSFMSGMYNFSQKPGGTTTLEQMGLGDYATMAYAYNNNRSEFENKLLDQLNLIKDIDMNDKDALDQIEKRLAEQNSNKNFWEKFTDGVFTFFGLQNGNWEALNGTVQMLNTVVSGTVAAINVYQAAKLVDIKGLVAALLVKQGVNSGDLKSILTSGGFKGGGLASSLGGLKIGGASGMAAIGGVAGILAGGVMGISDAVNMQGSTGKGWLADSARGFFLGRGSSNLSDSENLTAGLSNGAKLGLIGAGIGTLIAPGIGTVVGGLLGGGLGLIFGALGSTMEDNTKAVEDNTKAYESDDSIVTKSYLKTIYEAYNSTNKTIQNQGAVSYGVGSGGTSNTGGYPWAVTSPYGPRTLSNGDSRFHNGIDFGITTGTPVGSPVSGKVQYVQIDPYNTYHLGAAGIGRGTGVNLLGDDGVIYQFWHLSKTGLQVGDKVDAGGLIGLSGNTGYSTGEHLHFGAKVGGNWVNPTQYIKEGLFSADGKSYTSTNALSLDNMEDPSYYYAQTTNSKQFFKKDALFSYTNGSGAAPDTTIQSPNYATSSDVDRLIDTINSMREEQNNQRAFMQALAGKNAFVYGRS